ncbi:uncharacterized protein ARB_06174 [Trichophyton benhamiae CBS 112371]|uniref:Uncharacterized protein n=1 Tax=Arthroderma benhamiae (strain ATCC MYA-4681 / CBS 112371) TaxID=663331 RepID=D4APK6_ARTBC|nr:uncharacterized protein ARB_06174 [Trichophyton benhamiae CBS 112371]EFE35217.1 hypothetical protein ARB_06174 [Trichophyton benhamiae CBS 112371]
MYKSGENAPVQLTFASKKPWGEGMIRLPGTYIIKRRVRGTAFSDSYLDRNPCQSTDQQRTLWNWTLNPIQALMLLFFFFPFALFQHLIGLRHTQHRQKWLDVCPNGPKASEERPLQSSTVGKHVAPAAETHQATYWCILSLAPPPPLPTELLTKSATIHEARRWPTHPSQGMTILVSKIYETLSTSGIRMQALGSFDSGPAAARFFLLFSSEREKKARDKWHQKAMRARKKKRKRREKV